MQIAYTPQRSGLIKREITYTLDGSILSITEDGTTTDVDLDTLPEEHDYPIVSVTDDTVTVIQFYGDDERDLYET